MSALEVVEVVHQDPGTPSPHSNEQQPPCLSSPDTVAQPRHCPIRLPFHLSHSEDRADFGSSTKSADCHDHTQSLDLRRPQAQSMSTDEHQLTGRHSPHHQGQNTQPQKRKRSHHPTQRTPLPVHSQSANQAPGSCGKERARVQGEEEARIPRQRSNEQQQQCRLHACPCMLVEQHLSRSPLHAELIDHRSANQAPRSLTISSARRGHSQSQCLRQARAPRQYTAERQDSCT